MSNKVTVNDLPAARRAAVAWANNMLRVPFVIVDLETTDKDPMKAEPVQIAIVSSDGKTLYKSYVRPQKRMAAEASEKTGITWNMLQHEPTFEQVYPHIAEVLLDKVVVAFNVGFDQVVLRETSKRLKLNDPTGTVKWQDAMVEFSNFYGDWHVHDYWGGSYRWKGLSHAVLTFSLTNEAAHDAEGDAIATLRVIKALAAVDFTKPQVYHFEMGKITILYPDGKSFLIQREGEGAAAAIKAEVMEQWNASPITSAPVGAVPSISMPEDEILREREALNSELAAYAVERVEIDALKKALEDREKSIKQRYMRLVDAGVPSPHDALLVKETKKWVYSEDILAELAREHDKSLLVERLDEKQFEGKLMAGLFSWAGAFAPALQVNRFAAFHPNALKLVAASRQNVVPVVKDEPPAALTPLPPITPITEIEKKSETVNEDGDESWREKIPS